MTATKTKALIDRLDDARRSFGSGNHNPTEKILTRFARHKIDNAEFLIRLHELLLFICAYPQSARAKRLAESLRKSFSKRVATLHEADVNLDSLEHPEVSGVAGMSVTDTFSFFIVRWLVRRYPTQIRFYWDWFEDENRLAQTWPRFMPLLEEDAAVEANVPYRTWLRSALGSAPRDLQKLMRQFDQLPTTEKEKAELYDSQQLYVQWTRSEESRVGKEWR